MQNALQSTTNNIVSLEKVSAQQQELCKSSLTPQSSNSSPAKSETETSEFLTDFMTDSTSDSDDDVPQVTGGFDIEGRVLEGTCGDPSHILLAAEECDLSDFNAVDQKTQARLAALLEVAGVGKLTCADGKAFTDQEVLRQLTTSVSCALDEAAAALTRMKCENPRSHDKRSLAEACSDGDVPAVRKLLDEGRSVHETTEEGESLLSLASSAGYYELAQVLLAMRANVEDRGVKGDCTPLMEAASSGHANIVCLLLNHGAEVNAQSASGNTPLMYACAGGHTDVVSILLDAKANVEDHNENGHTPLMEAASAGHVDVAKLLLTSGAGINTHSNEFKESALTLACYKGHLEMVRYLLQAGADQEHKTDEMHTALMEASMDGHVEVARLLLDSGAQVNMPADSFESPLTLAACGGHVDLAMLLIERGAKIEEVNDEGYTPLMEAAREGHEEMVALLLGQEIILSSIRPSHSVLKTKQRMPGVQDQEEGMTPQTSSFYFNGREGQREIEDSQSCQIRKYTKIAIGANINSQTEETQETALTLAACGGFADVVEFLLNAGADIEQGASTPLMEAAQEGHVDLVRLLLDRSANIHAQTQTGDTSLTYACENGHDESVKLLLERGADIEQASEGGRTPLMKACRSGHLQTVNILLSHKADVSRATANNDHTALSLACAGGHASIVELLLSHGADPYHKLKDNSTMLIESAKGGHKGIVQMLLDYPSIAMPQEPSDPVASSSFLANLSQDDRHKLNKAVLKSGTHAQPVQQTKPLVVQKSVLRKTRSTSVPSDSNLTSSAAEVQHQLQALAFGETPEMKINEDKCCTPLTTPEKPQNQQQREKEILEEIHQAEREFQQHQQHLPSEPGNPVSVQSVNLPSGIFDMNTDQRITGLFHPVNVNSLSPSNNIYAGPKVVDPSFPTLFTSGEVLVPSATPCTVSTGSTGGAVTPSQVTAATPISDRVKAKPVSKKEARKLQPVMPHPFFSQPQQACNPQQMQAQLPPHFQQELFQMPQSLKTVSPSVSTAGMTAQQQQLFIHLQHVQNNPNNNNIPAVIPQTVAQTYAASVAAQSGQRLQQFRQFQQQMEQHGPNVMQSPHPMYGAVPFTQPPLTGYEHVMNSTTKENSTSSSEVSLESRSKIICRGAKKGKKDYPLGHTECCGEKNIEWNSEVVAQNLANLSLATHTGPIDTESLNIVASTPAPLGTFTGLPLPEDQAAEGGGTVTVGKMEYFPVPPTSDITAAQVMQMTPGLQVQYQQYPLNSTITGTTSGLQIAPGTMHLTTSGEMHITSAAGMAGVQVTSTASMKMPGGMVTVPVQNQLIHGGNPLAVNSPVTFQPHLVLQHPPMAYPGHPHSTVLESNGDSSPVYPQSTPAIQQVQVSTQTPPTSVALPTIEKKNKGKKGRNGMQQCLPPCHTMPNKVPQFCQQKVMPLHQQQVVGQQQGVQHQNNVAYCPYPIDPATGGQYVAPYSPGTYPTTALPHVDLESETESNHDTALTLAAAGGHEELVELLLQRGSNIEHKDKKGFTPLILAATAGHERTVEVLLKHGADIEAQSERTKDTPLSLACSGGRLEVVDLLLRRGANKEHRNVSDYTPLSLAASGGYTNIIKLLLNNGAEINSRTGSKLGISPLMLASMNGHTAAVKLLLDRGSDINAQIETNRNTALTLACFQGRHEVVSLLLDRKANVEHRAKTGLTPLMEAASGGYVEVGRVLLDKGADVNAAPVPSSKDTALTISADKGHFRFSDLLLSRHAHVEVRNKKGNTPLWLASNGGYLEVVQLLYSHGANIDAQDNRKTSCLLAAFRKGHVRVVKWMVKHVLQFPSDYEMDRYLSTISDKELLKRSEQCYEVINAAKEKQAAEANKIASILLEEIDMEKSRVETKKLAAARRRERKRKRRMEKKEEKKKAEDDDDLEEEEEEEEDLPAIPQQTIHKSQTSSKDIAMRGSTSSKAEESQYGMCKGSRVPDPSTSASTSRVRDEREEGDSGIDANSQGSSSSGDMKVKTSNDSKKSGRKKRRKNDLQSHCKETQTSTVKNADNNSRVPQTTDIMCNSSSAVPEQIVWEQPSPPSKLSKKCSAASEFKGKQADESLNRPNELLPSQRHSKKSYNMSAITLLDSMDEFGKENFSIVLPPPAKSAKQLSKKEDGWKEVVRSNRESRNPGPVTPSAKYKKVVVTSNVVSRVIGRGGTNINAIREATGAHIEVEKQTKGQGERSIQIRGSADSTRQAHQLIMALIKDPELDLQKLLPKSAKLAVSIVPVIPTVKATTMTTSKKTTPCTTSKPTVASTTVFPSVVSVAITKSISSVTVTSSNLTSKCNSSLPPKNLAPRHLAAAERKANTQQKLQQSNIVVPATTVCSASTTLAYTVAITTGKNTALVTATATLTTTTVSSSSGSQQQTFTTMVSDVAVPSQVSPPVATSQSPTSPKVSPPPSRVGSAPILFPATPFQGLPPSKPPFSTSVSGRSTPSTQESTIPVAHLEYSPFNNMFSKSVWGRENDPNQKAGMNFVTGGCGPVPGNPTTATGSPHVAVDSPPLPEAPQADASKAPGYRGANTASPVTAKGYPMHPFPIPNREILSNSSVSNTVNAPIKVSPTQPVAPTPPAFQHLPPPPSTLPSFVETPRPSESVLIKMNHQSMQPGFKMPQTEIPPPVSPLQSRLNPQAPSYMAATFPFKQPPVSGHPMSYPNMTIGINKSNTPSFSPRTPTNPLRWSNMESARQIQVPVGFGLPGFHSSVENTEMVTMSTGSDFDEYKAAMAASAREEKKILRPIGTERNWRYMDNQFEHSDWSLNTEANKALGGWGTGAPTDRRLIRPPMPVAKMPPENASYFEPQQSELLQMEPSLIQSLLNGGAPVRHPNSYGNTIGMNSNENKRTGPPIESEEEDPLAIWERQTRLDILNKQATWNRLKWN